MWVSQVVVFSEASQSELQPECYPVIFLFCSLLLKENPQKRATSLSFLNLPEVCYRGFQIYYVFISFLINSLQTRR